MMDIQTRKIEFIEGFLKLKNETVISRLELVLKKEMEKEITENLNRMTIDEFNHRIDRSMEDSSNGKLTEGNDLITEVKKWS